jgi:hypothetical protein
MKTVEISIPKVALIAGTRGMLGTGIGLLLADRLPGPRRRAVGWSLLTIGVLSTIPLALSLFRKNGEPGLEAEPVVD